MDINLLKVIKASEKAPTRFQLAIRKTSNDRNTKLINSLLKGSK